MMVRTQIQLTQQQARRLKELAKKRGVSMAELIREGVEKVLDAPEAADLEERKRRALAIVGIASDVPDLGVNHDEYLDEAYSA